MLSIFINNKEVTLPKRVSVLEACKKAGVEIPRYCYHESLSIAGNCRMCVVELKNSPKPLISCATPIINGMVVYTESPLVKKARESTMEFLLLNHPLDCPVCDQGGECDLQDQSLFFGSDKNRFYSVKRTVKDKNLGPIVKTVMTRCIHCTRCVRFAEEISGVDALGTFNRGMSTEIGTYINKTFTTELSGNVIDLCPVGALTSKPYSFVSRPWELKTLKTIDFSDGFGTDVQVAIKNNVVVKVLSSFNSKKDNIWISDKTRFSFDSMFSNSVLEDNVFEKHNKSTLSFWQNLLKDVVYLIYFAEHLISHKYQPIKITVIFDSNTNIEVLTALMILSKKYSFIVLRCLEPFNVDTDLETNFLMEENYDNKLNDTDLVLLIGFNSRYESSVLNIALKKRYKKGSFKVISFSSFFDSTFPIEFVGSNLKTLQNFVEGKHILCQQLSLSKNPVILVGSQFYKKNNPKILDSFIKNISSFSKIKSITSHLVSSTISSSALAYLNLTKPVSLRDLQTTSCTYLIDINYSNSGISKLIASLVFQNLLTKNFSSLLEQNNIFTKNLTLKNLEMEKLYNKTFELPSTNFFQQSATYLTTNSKFKKSYKVIKSSKISKHSWKIIKGFAYYLRFFNSMLLNNQYSSIVDFDSFNNKHFLNYFYLPASNLNVIFNYSDLKRGKIDFNSSDFNQAFVKSNNVKLFFQIDDFYIGGQDSYSKTSNVMVKCSKTLRQDSSNFKFIK